MKKIFLSLLLGFVGLISFSNAGKIYIYTNSTQLKIPLSNQSGILTIERNDGNNYNASVTPISCTEAYGNAGVSLKGSNTVTLNFNPTSPAGPTECLFIKKPFDWSGYINMIISGDIIDSGCPVCQECETCPEVNTGDILSGSCDTNYCVENDLCPVPSNFSQLFINDLEFPGKPLINVNIPDYIHWDYSSNDTGFDLYVGSGYDQDYIDSVLKINSYRPDSSDFTNIFVSGLTLLFPYLIFALFLVFMRKLIKRIFKH